VSRPAPGALRDLARLFLKLGTLGFGGPAAHIALMEDEVVRCRGWMTRERFLDLLGATNLIPGPNSTEMAIHVGHERAGARGLVVAGVSFILPAFLIVLACAWAYTRYGTLPVAEGLLRGVKPVIIAIVLQALWSLGRAAARTRGLAAVGLLSLAAPAAGGRGRPSSRGRAPGRGGAERTRSPPSRWVRPRSRRPRRERRRSVSAPSSSSS
jgi:chromate transporter